VRGPELIDRIVEAREHRAVPRQGIAEQPCSILKSLFKKLIESNKKQKCTSAKNGKMEVPLQPI
jgi:hypothetical protein